MEDSVLVFVNLERDMEKTIKDSTIEEYRNACFYKTWDETGRLKICNREGGNCAGFCPRMERWRRIHK